MSRSAKYAKRSASNLIATQLIRICLIVLLMMLGWMMLHAHRAHQVSDRLTPEQQQALTSQPAGAGGERSSTDQAMASQDDESTRIAEQIQSCHLVGQWRSDRQGPHYLIQLQADGQFSYQAENPEPHPQARGINSGQGRWGWSQAQVVWRPSGGGIIDNNPLREPMWYGRELGGFVLIEQDGSRTPFERIGSAPSGECPQD